MTLLHRYERLIVYGLVGGCLAFLYSGLTALFILGHLVEDRTLASAIASLLTIPISFFVHQRTTYRDVRQNASQRIRFALVALCTFAIAIGTMHATAVMGWPFWVALVVSWVMIPIGNFAINAIWVFRTKNLWSLDRVGERSL